MCNGRHRYCIHDIRSEMPNWMSYSGEGYALSFHLPPVFHGLVLWMKDYYYLDIFIIIRNKSNNIHLFKGPGAPRIEGRLIYLNRSEMTTGWMRYISRSEMAMEDYCADDELELYFYYEWWEALHINECGVHVIAGKSDSFEELEVGKHTVMPSPPTYHLLLHPTCGSITASTPKQWSDFLFTKLQGHALDLGFVGKNPDDEI
ncbi:uncharacterized protein [Populus alba]|uniref:uncharacterized protein n=1 Tax=Populus alba TaxID=43335 RepID=UPI003CC77E52